MRLRYAEAANLSDMQEKQIHNLPPPLIKMSETYEETQTFKVKGVVDICFLLDITGSMQPCIDAVKNNIKSFCQSLVTPDANGGVVLKDWRACICGYRDFEYEPKHGREAMVMNPFTRDVNELYAQLDAMQAQGGGDEPESLLDALYTVVTRGKTPKGAEPEPDKWRYASSAARCLIVLTDAPFHETMVVDAAKGGTVQDICNLLQQERIRLSLFAPEMQCHHALAVTDKSEYEEIQVDPSIDPVRARQKALADYTSDPANFANTMALLAKSVSQSGAADVEEL